MTAHHQTATRPNQLSKIVLFVLGSLAVAIALHAFLWIGRANADPAPTAIDHVPAISAPMTQASADTIASAQAATATAWDTIATYGPLWGALLLTFGSIGAFLRANESKHWLAQGRALAYLTTGMMLIGAVLTWRFHGGDTAGLLLSVFLAIKMLISPTVASPPATVSQRDPQAGRSRLAVLILLAVVASIALPAITLTLGGCTHAQRVAATHALWDCTSPARAELVTATTPLAISAIKLATNPDGSIDSVKLKAFFRPANLLSEAGVVISCAAVAAFDVLRSAASRQTLLAGDGVSPDALTAAELALRAPWGGAKFQIADGVR